MICNGIFLFAHNSDGGVVFLDIDTMTIQSHPEQILDESDDNSQKETNSSTTSSPGLKLNRVVPDIVATEITQRFQERMEKQRKIFANLIFPSHIPGPCHPNVSSLVETIRDLQQQQGKQKEHRLEAAVAVGKGRDTIQEGGVPAGVSATKEPTEKHDMKTLQSTPPRDTQREVTCPFSEIVNIHEKCDVYLRRAKNFERLAKEQSQQLSSSSSSSSPLSSSSLSLLSSSSDQSARLIETVSMSEIFHMNYRYCIASVSCPERVAVLNHCYSQYPPDVVKALVMAGQHDFICNKEKKAVERCCGQKVQAVIRSLQQSTDFLD